MFPKKKVERSRKPRTAGGKVPLTYYRSGSSDGANRPPEKKAPPRKKLKKFLTTALSLIIVVIILVGLFYTLIVKPTPKIILSSASYHQPSDYYSFASAQLSSLKNRSKVTFDQNSVIENIKKKYPEISSASVELPLFSQTPTLRLNISTPSFFLSSSGESYVVDNQGVVIAKKEALPQITNLPLLVDESGFSARVGQQVLGQQGAAFIISLVAQCAKAKVPVQSLILPPLAQELDLRTTDRGYSTKFFLGSDPLSQIGQFLAARHKFDVSGEQPAQYLDVRVAGKVFYK